MGLLNSLRGGVLGQLEAAALPALISAALAKTNLGNLQGLVTQLQQGGLDKQVQSGSVTVQTWALLPTSFVEPLEMNKCASSLSILGSTPMRP